MPTCPASTSFWGLIRRHLDGQGARDLGLFGLVVGVLVDAQDLDVL